MVVQKSHPCQIYSHNMCAHPTPLHPLIANCCFSQWGIDFMPCNPPSTQGHHYIMIVVDYFTKIIEVMPMHLNNGNVATLFSFNHKHSSTQVEAINQTLKTMLQRMVGKHKSN